MDLEKKVKRTRIVRRVPSSEVMGQVNLGNKFIVVEESFDLSFVPQGYSLIDIIHEDGSFKALVPQGLLFYMANPGEGDIDDALEEIADFYGEAEYFEDDMIGEGGTSVQEADWATLAQSTYVTYLINKLVRHRPYSRTGPVPEFDQEVISMLDLDDPYVEQRVRAIAAIALGKQLGDIKQHDVSSVLKHVTIQEKREELVRKRELRKIECYAGSHYEYKLDYAYYRNHSNYVVRKGKVYKKIDQKEVAVLNSQIEELESEINAHRLDKHGSVGRHDSALIRQYTNLGFIVPENPQAQLHIEPPEKNE